jgi:RNA binding exosome subunit
MDRFPVLERLTVENYRLYPGTTDTPGIDFAFQNGVSLLAGINGLGKTTLINMIFRLIVGPFELKKDSASGKFGSAARSDVTDWPLRNRFFTHRVADRAAQARATLWFQIGGHRFSVTRSLSTLRITAATFDGNDIPIEISEDSYRRLLLQAANASAFVDFLTVVKYLTFFNEERRDILWDEQAQRQFFRILFTEPKEALQWIELEGDISRADSRARNISATKFQFEEEHKSALKLLENVGVDAALAAEQALQYADLETQAKLSKLSEEMAAELTSVRRDLERSKIAENDARRKLERHRFERLNALFPTLSDTAKYIFTQLYAEGTCLACEQPAEAAAEQLASLVEKNCCAVCGQSLSSSPRIGEAVAVTDVEFKEAKDAVNAATVQRKTLDEYEQQLEGRWKEISKQLGELGGKINLRAKTLETLKSQLPPPPEDILALEQQIAALAAREKDFIEKRTAAEATYAELLKIVNDKIRRATQAVSEVFERYIARFLEEDAKVKFQTISDRPSQSGRFFQYASVRFEMTAAGFEGHQVRETPEDVSESQREFIDLAFRMAMMDIASHDGSLSLVIETPEASLDAIFMDKAAQMFRDFAHGNRTVVVTSNLTSSVMIPALMGDFTEDPDLLDQRRRRVLNLLKVAAPNAAIRHHSRAYDAFLEAGLLGGTRR